jgi:hypothetical protein
MNKNHTFDLSILALSVITAIVLLVTPVIVGYCGSSLVNADVSTSVSTQTLSAVSGTNLPLTIAIKNEGASMLKGGEAVITISRESKSGDFSRGNEFVVTRSVVKSGINLDASASEESSFAWKIPAMLPSGVYRADATLVHRSKIFSDASSGTPFAGSAKILISGEASTTVFFVAGTEENDEPSITLVNATNKFLKLPVSIKTYSGNVAGPLLQSESRIVSADTGAFTFIEYLPLTEGSYAVTAETAYQGVPAFYVFTKEGSAQCFDPNTLYPWAMLIGGLGVVMLILVYNRKQRVLMNN